MQYSVTIDTNEGKQINHISARNLTSAIIKVNKYNEKHPTWIMRMMQCAPASDNCIMPVILLRK